jgi:hypothetical protein
LVVDQTNGAVCIRDILPEIQHHDVEIHISADDLDVNYAALVKATDPSRGLIRRDRLIGINNDDVTDWPFLRICQRVNDFRVPPNSDVKLKFVRKLGHDHELSSNGSSGALTPLRKGIQDSRGGKISPRLITKSSDGGIETDLNNRISAALAITEKKPVDDMSPKEIDAFLSEMKEIEKLEEVLTARRMHQDLNEVAKLADSTSDRTSKAADDQEADDEDERDGEDIVSHDSYDFDQFNLKNEYITAVLSVKLFLKAIQFHKTLAASLFNIVYLYLATSTERQHLLI